MGGQPTKNGCNQILYAKVYTEEQMGALMDGCMPSARTTVLTMKLKKELKLNKKENDNSHLTHSSGELTTSLKKKKQTHTQER